jgi:hypothetical protein
MSNHPTSKDLPSVISSPESEDGAEHLSLQDGAQTDLFGQEALPVSPSQQQAKEKEKMTHGIFSQSSLISSESANLQRSLVSRLRQLSDLGGSTIYKLTLKEKVTPQQRQYYQLAASAPRTKGTDSSSWPTPTQRDYKGGRKLDSNAQNSSATTGVRYGLSLDQAPQLVPWPTPMQTDGSKACNRYQENYQNGLGAMASTVDSWATPTARDYKCTGNMENYIFGSPTGRIRTDSVPTQAYLIETPWPTPAARDVAGKSGAGRQKRKGNPSDTVPNAAATVLWATPNTMDHMALRSDEALLKQATVARKGRTFPANLREQVDPRSQEIYASGKIPQSSTAETENTAPSQLNPRFSLWLMGYPIEWAYCAERVTPLSRKRQPKS